jgi:hypothetical protein
MRQSFWQLLRGIGYELILTKNGLGQILGDLLQTRLVTLTALGKSILAKVFFGRFKFVLSRIRKTFLNDFASIFV